MMSSGSVCGDHPRGCGEHQNSGPSMSESRGSSPRMRGALELDRPACFQPRIIPADAGSTMYISSESSIRWDHPRGCGEHVLAPDVADSVSGSSPRMRGARRVTVATLPMVRIIPADAGSTCLVSGVDVIFEDHPRGCGEHSPSSIHRHNRRGSSPRMRGALMGPHPIRTELRIIPADAGSTCQW